MQSMKYAPVGAAAVARVLARLATFSMGTSMPRLPRDMITPCATCMISCAPHAPTRAQMRTDGASRTHAASRSRSSPTRSLHTCGVSHKRSSRTHARAATHRQPGAHSRVGLARGLRRSHLEVLQPTPRFHLGQNLSVSHSQTEHTPTQARMRCV